MFLSGRIFLSHMWTEIIMYGVNMYLIQSYFIIFYYFITVVLLESTFPSPTMGHQM